MNSLKSVWSEGKTALGAWLSLRDPFVAEAAATSGFDYVCIDMQHGLADYEQTVVMLHAIGADADGADRPRAVERARHHRPSARRRRDGRHHPDGEQPGGGEARRWTRAGTRRRALAASARSPRDARTAAATSVQANDVGRVHPDDRDPRRGRDPRRHPGGAGHRRGLRRPRRPLGDLWACRRGSTAGRPLPERARPRSSRRASATGSWRGSTPSAALAERCARGRLSDDHRVGFDAAPVMQALRADEKAARAAQPA